MIELALIGPSHPFRSGIARCTTFLAEELERKGVRFCFYTVIKQYPRWLFPGKSDLDENTCPRFSKSVPSYSNFSIISWVKLLIKLKRNETKQILTPFWTSATFPFLLFLIFFSKIKIFLIVHNLCEHESNPISKLFGHIILKNSSGFFCHSKEVKNELLSRFPRTITHAYPEPPPILKIKNITQRNAKKELGIDEDSFIFLFFGIIRHYKNLPLLINTFSKISKDKKVALIIAGEPWTPLPKINDTRIHLYPHWIPEKKVETFFKASNCLVLPYKESSGSGVAALGMAYGLPLLSSNLGIFQDITTDENGLLFEPNNSNSLLTQMNKATKQFEQQKIQPSSLSWKKYADTVKLTLNEASQQPLFHKT